MATAQNGWTASANKAALGVDSNFAVAGVKFPGGVLSGDVSTVLRYVAEQFHQHVEPLHDGWCWGYAYRDIRGSTGLSNHAAACAIDVNAPDHPLGKRGTFSTAQVARIRLIVQSCGGVVAWGGEWSRPDEMHFEIVGSAAAVGAVADRIRRTGGTAPTPAPPPSTQNLKRGSTGDRVKTLQRVLNAWYPSLRLVVDGIYGPATEKAVRDMQARAGLVVDGIAGPATLGRLGLA